MPGMGGMELLRVARERHPDLPAMMITGYATVSGAVEALQSGVAEYLAKPFTKGELHKAVERVLEKVRTIRAAGHPPLRDARRRFGLVGGAPAMTALFAALERAAASTPAPVLLVGEAGTGRTAAARGLTARGTLVVESCASLVQTAPKVLLERAAGGALFLRGLDFAPEAALGRLAELVRRPDRLARILVGCSPALAIRVEKGHFPRALYEALAPQTVFVPPLRERQEDVARLLLSFFRRAFASAAFPFWPLFSPQLLEQLTVYSWPGNVAELEDVAAHLFARLAGRTLVPADLPARFRQQGSAAGRTLAAVETEHIRLILDQVAGNKSRAAEILGIDRKTLREKLKTPTSD
jgi:DNA-binding NtrC family response regulator